MRGYTALPQLLISCSCSDLRRGRYRCHAEPKLVHQSVLYIVQFPWCAALDREYIPSRATRHRALCCVYRRLVFMQAAAVTPTVGPSCLVMEIKERVPQA